MIKHWIHILRSHNASMTNFNIKIRNLLSEYSIWYYKKYLRSNVISKWRLVCTLSEPVT